MFRSNRRTLTSPNTSTVVVFNQFSIDAQLAAAVIYGELKSESRQRQISIFNSTQIVPSDADRYIWVGLEPDLAGKAKMRFKTSEHTVLGKHEKELGWKDRLRLTIGMDRLNEAEVSTENLTLLEHAVATYAAYTGNEWRQDLGVQLQSPDNNRVRLVSMQNTSPVMRISNLIRSFYSPSLSEHELVLLYVNWRAAMETIESGKPFRWTEVKPDDTVSQTAWLGFVKTVKRRINGNVDFSLVVNKETRQAEPYVWTAWSGEDYSWAMRLISHSQRRILNVVEGISGRIITSPFSRVENLKLQGHFRAANIY